MAKMVKAICRKMEENYLSMYATSQEREQSRPQYKKPPQRLSYTLSAISPVQADMNLTLALSCMIAVMWLFCGRCKAAPGLTTGVHRNLRNHPHIRGYAMEGLVKDFVEDLVGEDEDILQLNKRQQLDDYGHMRFGKRTNSNDEEYGHPRFGRNIE